GMTADQVDQFQASDRAGQKGYVSETGIGGQMPYEMDRQSVILECGASKTDDDCFAGAGHSLTDRNYRLTDRMI
ncbi:MAG: hypothetical protein PHD25_11505, partial [Bacteroidales bacterium]|nr:hypothetical protein [Bacteroidales bacterium]